MRKPRDYDAELKALTDRANQLKSRKVQQLGELVIASGADTLSIDILTGALIAAGKEKDAAVREGWRKAGASFFQRTRRAPNQGDAPGAAAAPDASGTPPLDGGKSAS